MKTTRLLLLLANIIIPTVSNGATLNFWDISRSVQNGGTVDAVGVNISSAIGVYQFTNQASHTGSDFVANEYADQNSDVSLSGNVLSVSATGNCDASINLLASRLGYLIHFPKVITLLAYDESCATHRLYYKMSGWIKGVRAYQWIDSPWLDGYRGCHEIRGSKLYHYVIFGDDNLVEVISVGEARIERVDEKRFIEVTHEV